MGIRHRRHLIDLFKQMHWHLTVGLRFALNRLKPHRPRQPRANDTGSGHFGQGLCPLTIHMNRAGRHVTAIQKSAALRRAPASSGTVTCATFGPVIPRATGSPPG